MKSVSETLFSKKERTFIGEKFTEVMFFVIGGIAVPRLDAPLLIGAYILYLGLEYTLRSTGLSEHDEGRMAEAQKRLDIIFGDDEE